MSSRLPIIILFIAVVAMIPSVEAAQTNDTRDGNWWTTQTLVLKVPYVLGMFDAVDAGSTWSLLEFQNQTEKNCFESSAVRFAAQRRTYLVGVTSGQVVDGLDRFYEDWNRAIGLGVGFELVLRSIAGEDITDLTMLRRRVPKN